MRIVYIDDDFKCHLTNPDGILREVKTNIFDGKCDDFVEGSRLVPNGESWTREDGKVFTGEMRTPWKPSSELENAQREYERQKLADAENALAILLGGEST